MNETVTTIVGNVVDNPVRRRLESGVSVTTFRVASSARRFDRTAQRWIDGDSLYLRVTCWRQLAENVDRSIVKGDPVVVTGRLFTRLYEVDEQRRASYELEATAMGFDLNRGTARFTRAVKNAGATVDEVGSDGMPVAPTDASLPADRTGEDALESDPDEGDGEASVTRPASGRSEGSGDEPTEAGEPLAGRRRRVPVGA